MRRTALLLTLFLVGAACAAEPPRTHQVKLNGQTFTLPAGFTIELAADSKLAPRPITADFDEQGRLYFADANGSVTKEDVAQKKPMHRIVRLEDSDGDGKFDKSVVFADQMLFPEGTMWLDGSLYVAAPPHIWKLTDTDGDGKADKREIWFDGKTLTGCANDLHGPYRGPDGWIYWCKGAFAKQEYKLPGGQTFVTRASHIFRARPDGTGIEPVMTGGMDNPVDLVFTPTGDIIFSTTFFQHPADGKRDGLIHAVYGGIYGKVHDVIFDPVHKWTGPDVMPVLTHMGPAAPCGLHRLESASFGPEYKDNIFCCQFNMRKVSRHVLIPHGSTYRTEDFDFVVSDSLDFHPTDVIEDADGSLLIVDTGGWYKLCCPTSQLVKPDVLGGIYRVRRANQRKLPGSESHARGWKNNWRQAITDSDERVRLIGLHMASLHRENSALQAVVKLLGDSSPHVRRSAAGALGRMGDASTVGALLASLGDIKNDRALDHALTFALIQISARLETEKALAHESPRVRRAALTALDQMPGGKLDVKHVAAAMKSDDAALRATALWIASRHPEWGGELAGYFRERLASAMSDADSDALAAQLARFASNDSIQALVAEAIRNVGKPSAARTALRTVAQANLKKPPDSWPASIAAVLEKNEGSSMPHAIAAARVTAGPAVSAALARVGNDGSQTDAIRLAALAAIPPGQLKLEESLFDFVLARIHRDRELSIRASAVDVLTRAGLSPEQLVRLAATLKTAGPIEITRLLDAFKGNNEKVALALVSGLDCPEVRPAIRTELVKPKFEKLGPAVQKSAAKLYAALDAQHAQQRSKLEALLANLKDGDVRRGQIVFNSEKAACASCHKIGYKGGLVGPDLTRIGGIRSERDLLESIVFPSLSFVRSYEPVRVSTTNGKEYNGILKKDAPDEVILALNAQEEVRIARKDIDEITPSLLSVMPAGLDQQLTPQDLADLVAFLKACK